MHPHTSIILTRHKPLTGCNRNGENYMSKKLSEMTLEELRALDAGAWKDPAFAGTRIPTVEEFLEYVCDKNIVINWELKEYPMELDEEWAYGTIDRLIELIDRYGEFGKPVKNLMYISLIRHMAERTGMSLVKFDNGEIRIFAEKFDVARWSSVAFALDNRVRFVTSMKTYISCKLKKGEDVLKVLIKIFKTYESEE